MVISSAFGSVDNLSGNVLNILNPQLFIEYECCVTQSIFYVLCVIKVT